MQKWENDVAGEVVGLLVFVLITAAFLFGAFLVGAVMQGYDLLTQGEEIPQLNPPEEPTAPSDVNWPRGLMIGEKVPWQ